MAQNCSALKRYWVRICEFADFAGFESEPWFRDFGDELAIRERFGWHCLCKCDLENNPSCMDGTSDNILINYRATLA